MSKNKDPLDILVNNHTVQREILRYDNHDYFKNRVWQYMLLHRSMNGKSLAGWRRSDHVAATGIHVVVAKNAIRVAFLTSDNMIVCYRLTLSGLAEDDTYCYEQLIDAEMLHDTASFVFADTNDIEMLSTEIEQGLLVEHEHEVHDQDGFVLLRMRKDDIFDRIPDIIVYYSSELKKGDMAYINGNFITTMIALKFPAANISHHTFTHNSWITGYGYAAYRNKVNAKLVEEILRDVRMSDKDSVLRVEDMAMALNIFASATTIPSNAYQAQALYDDDPF